MLICVPFSNLIPKRRSALFFVFIFIWLILCGDVSALDLETKANSNKKKSGKNGNKRKVTPAGLSNFQTKMFLVLFSVFILIFIMVLLVVGHFTWFADIKEKLVTEWEEEKAKIEKDKAAKQILDEMKMKNPFDGNEIDKGMTAENKYRRKESFDSGGECSRGLCVPPHHSILCPNNTAIPSLSEPINNNYYQDSSYFLNEKNDNDNDKDNDNNDPIYYRRRPSSDWMNLDTCVKVSEPIPLRHDLKHFIMSSGCLIPRAPLTPVTPDPVAISSSLLPQVNKPSPSSLNINNNLSSLASDPELGDTENNRYPSLLNFDISKLDMF